VRTVHKTYQDVAYKTNTLAALDIASLASLDMLTPSGIYKYTMRQFNLNTVKPVLCDLPREQ